MRMIVSLFLFLFLATPAEAAWHRADSDHFVVYANDRTRDLVSFTRQLERFHSVLSIVTGTDFPKPSPSNRVTIYIVRSQRDVRKLHNGYSRFVGGFYVPRAGGSLAIVPRINTKGGEVSDSMRTLLHEYTHHFIYSTSTFPMPRWMSEGAAEFFSTASFERDGMVEVGKAANHRGPELAYAVDVNAEQLLDPDLYKAERGKSRSYDAFYGKSWLLYHYLTFDPARKGQLPGYIQQMIAGKSSREAALAIFGPFEELDKDLEKYLKKRRINILAVPHDLIRESPVAIRKLSAGEGAMMDVQIEAKTGVSEEEAAELVLKAREIVKRFPDDARVLSVLAENEFDAGNLDAAIAAADRAIALDPNSVNAYVQKGYALFAKAEEADDIESAYADAIRPFLQLNRVENDHPLPLVYFYRRFLELGVPPSELAINGLKRAAELAPFDLGLLMMLAQQQIRDRKYKAARRSLNPIAYHPHGGSGAAMARQLLEELQDDVPEPSENAAN